MNFLINWVKKEDEEIYLKIKNVFLTTYPYNLLSKELMTLIIEIYDTKSVKLRSWFLKYFEPLIIPDNRA